MTIGATMILPSDRYPFVVVEQHAKYCKLRELHDISAKTGHQPATFHGPYPVWDHIYTESELYSLSTSCALVTVRLHKDGGWYDKNGIRFEIGYARYYRDYSY